MTKKQTLSVLVIGTKKSKALKLLEYTKEVKHEIKLNLSPTVEEASKFVAENKVDVVMFDNKSQSDLILGGLEDRLTGLPNRRSMLEKLEHAIAYAKRYEIYCAVLYIDLDGFKPINDVLGRRQGDKLIQQVATRINSILRKADIFSRVGGDEFVAVLTRVLHVVDAGRVAVKINEALALPFKLNGKNYHITASIGIALYPNDHADPETLVQYADMAMSIVKRKGKSNYQYYKSELNVKAGKNIRITNDLRTAIKENKVELFFQPIVNITTNMISGIECLLRWEHPEYGFIPPAVFVPLAEETGLIKTLSEWVLKRACECCKKWEKMGLNKFHISVNWSIRNFQQMDYIDSVKACFEKTKVDPGRFIFEVTETVFSENQSEVIGKIELLKKMGIKIAIDDFGTGYSSLSYLKNLAIDIIKIDKNFVQAIEKRKRSRHNEIVLIMIELAKRLNMEVFAEGIETKEQFAFLKAAGCEYFQGYLFSTPVSFNKITPYLKRGFYS